MSVEGRLGTRDLLSVSRGSICKSSSKEFSNYHPLERRAARHPDMKNRQRVVRNLHCVSCVVESCYSQAVLGNMVLAGSVGINVTYCTSSEESKLINSDLN